MLNKLNLDKNKLTNQLQLLRQSQESLAGYSDGAKSLMKNARVRQYGRTITDLATKLDVPEKYEKALTAALGEAVDLLVLPEDGLDIDFLNRISPLIEEKVALVGLKGLSKIEAQRAPIGDGILGPAAELVRSPETMSVLLQQLLSQYLVVDSLERAFDLPPKIRESYNLVTLAGEVLMRSGIAILGKQKSASKVSFVRTRNELEDALPVWSKSSPKRSPGKRICAKTYKC